MLILMLPYIFYPLYKDFMFHFGSIRSLQLHSWNCGSVIYMLIIMFATLFSLLHKYFMIPICSHVINRGSVKIACIFILLTVF